MDVEAVWIGRWYSAVRAGVAGGGGRRTGGSCAASSPLLLEEGKADRAAAGEPEAAAEAGFLPPWESGVLRERPEGGGGEDSMDGSLPQTLNGRRCAMRCREFARDCPVIAGVPGSAPAASPNIAARATRRDTAIAARILNGRCPGNSFLGG